MVKRSISRDKRNMKPTIAIFIALQFLIGGCARAERPAVRDQNSTLRKETPVVADPDTATQNRITQIAAEAKGSVGVLAVILETNATVASLNPQAHFPMQSVYKLPISMAVIKQVDAGKLRLDQKVPVATEDYVGAAAHSPIRDKYPNGTSLTTEELLRYALSESDGTASDVLMKLAGGHEAVQAHLATLGITDMIVLDTENAFTQDHSLQYRNYTTPEAGVSLLRALFERRGLSESGQALILKFMIESKPGAKRLKGSLPSGTVVAHKTGTSGTQNGITAATNDIGIITLPSGKHLAIAVFVSDSPADEATREGVIAKTAKAVWDSCNKS